MSGDTEYPNTTLLYITSTHAANVTPSAYRDYNPAFLVVSSTDYIRVPVDTWLPTPLAYDTFTRADGALGNSETTGPDGVTGPAVTARAWTAQAGTWGVSTNTAACSALAGGLGLATVPAGSANVVADIAVTCTAGRAGMVLRYTDGNNYLYAYHDATNAALIQRVGGVESNVVAPAAAAYAAGRVLRVVLDGTAGTLYYNNAKIGTTGAINAALTGTAHGLYTTNVGNSLDTFQCFPRGNGGEYAELDAY